MADTTGMRALAFVLLSNMLMMVPAWGKVHWLCGLSTDATSLVCVADTEPWQAEDASALRTPTARVNGTQFPLDPRRIYTVNFWSPATDLDFVAQLARATICYRSPDCNVIFSVSGAGGQVLAGVPGD
jgi:hypothetical protein